MQELQDLIIQQSERWDSTNCMLVDFDPLLHIPPEEDQILLNKYQMPQPSTFKPSRSVIEPMLTKVRHTVYRKIFLHMLQIFSSLNVPWNILEHSLSLELRNLEIQHYYFHRKFRAV